MHISTGYYYKHLPFSLGLFSRVSSGATSLSFVLSRVLILEPRGREVLMIGIDTGVMVAPRGRDEVLYSCVGAMFSLRSS